jgi:hypothetical protein
MAYQTIGLPVHDADAIVEGMKLIQHNINWWPQKYNFYGYKNLPVFD